MINIAEEKNRTLTAQDCYDILVLATTETLESCGFLSSYVFEHIVYVAAVKMLYEEFELDPTDGWLNLWKACIENGYLGEALETYPEDFEFLSDKANAWFSEYSSYANSGRSALDGLSMVIQDAVAGIKEIASDEEIPQLLKAANDWGMNNKG